MEVVVLSPKKVREVGKNGRSITDNITNSLANITNSLTNSITYILVNPSTSGNIRYVRGGYDYQGTWSTIIRGRKLLDFLRPHLDFQSSLREMHFVDLRRCILSPRSLRGLSAQVVIEHTSRESWSRIDLEHIALKLHNFKA